MQRAGGEGLLLTAKELKSERRLRGSMEEKLATEKAKNGSANRLDFEKQLAKEKVLREALMAENVRGGGGR
jgi:hypothetical protein